MMYLFPKISKINFVNVRSGLYLKLVILVSGAFVEWSIVLKMLYVIVYREIFNFFWHFVSIHGLKLFVCLTFRQPQNWHWLYATNLEELWITFSCPFIWRCVTWQQLRCRKLGWNPLCKCGNFLPVKATIYKLLVLKIRTKFSRNQTVNKRSMPLAATTAVKLIMSYPKSHPNQHFWHWEIPIKELETQ